MGGFHVVLACLITTGTATSRKKVGCLLKVYPSLNKAL